MDPLKEYRDKIDAIDQEILQAFLKRLTIVQKIVEVKKERGLPIFDEKREREVIKKRMELLPSSENFELVEKLFYTKESINKEGYIVLKDLYERIFEKIFGGKSRITQFYYSFRIR